MTLLIANYYTSYIMVPLMLYINHVTLIFFDRGTSGIDIDLRRVDIDQCPQKSGNTQLNIFAASDKCKFRTTKVRFTETAFCFLLLLI